MNPKTNALQKKVAKGREYKIHTKVGKPIRPGTKMYKKLKREDTGNS